MKGHITKIIKKTPFGVIVGDDNQKYSFHFVSMKDKVKPMMMDYVEFEPSVRNNRLVAINIEILDAPEFEFLLHKHTSNQTLVGYLKFLAGDYYVKDRDTKIMVKMAIGTYETNLEKYEQNVNQLVEYKITSLGRKKNVKGYLADREFIPECYRLNEPDLTGRITQIQKAGLTVLVFDKIAGFVPRSLVHNIYDSLKEGQIIPIMPIKITATYESAVFQPRI
jgi:hypothetical protein